MGRKIDVDDVIDSSDVAELLGLSHRNAITLYQKRYEDMPRPIIVKNQGRTLLWLRSEISAWAKQAGRTKH
jgi:predicted DNA-binding transcriptional regulator AlpA